MHVISFILSKITERYDTLWYPGHKTRAATVREMHLVENLGRNIVRNVYLVTSGYITQCSILFYFCVRSPNFRINIYLVFYPASHKFLMGLDFVVAKNCNSLGNFFCERCVWGHCHAEM